MLGLPVLAAFMGCLALLLSPVFLQRGCLGWYDTDPYNYLFPILILGFFFGAMRQPKLLFRFGLGAGFLTGLYSLFWSGWPFIWLLLSAVCVVSYFLSRFRMEWGEPLCGKFLLIYIAASLAFLAIAMTPVGFIRSIWDALRILPEYAAHNRSLWPNVFVAVGETKSIDVLKLIYLSGNFAIFILAVTGVVGLLITAWRSQDRSLRLNWTAWGIITLPLFALALKTERFSLLFSLPLAVWAAYGMEFVMETVSIAVRRMRPNAGWTQWSRNIAAALVMMIVIPAQVIFAHAVSMKMEPIMNDAWFRSLVTLREKTPEDAVVYSWWPPGHFITSVARRAVFTDGASQHLPETYWMARLFMAEDEREAYGIMRMLYAGGNAAVEWLRSQGWNLPDSIKLIGELILRDRDDALRILQERGIAEGNSLLKLTHGEGRPGPASLFLYNDMMEKALAVSVMGRWDFDRAAELFHGKGKKPVRYLDTLSMISSGFLKYEPESIESRREGGRLFFNNGLEVDLESGQSVITKSGKMPIAGSPEILFIFDGTELKEIAPPGSRLNISALVFERDGKYVSVLADKSLIRSFFFRLYYLQGAGIDFVKPLFHHYDSETRTRLMAYECLWPS